MVLAPTAPPIHKSDLTISQELVKLSTETLRYCSKTLAASPLQQLFLIDEMLADPDIPNSVHNRQLRLQQLLVNLIVDGFSQRCQLLHIKLSGPDEPIQAAEQTIVQVGYTSNPELISWCWLYYYYVCVDLNISQTQFIQLIHVEARTLRRYQQHAFRRLTEQIIYMETTARKRFGTNS